MGFIAPPYVGSSQSWGRTHVPVLTDRFLTTGPPGKSSNFLLISGVHAVLFPPDVHKVYIYIYIYIYIYKIGSQICLSFLANQLALKLLLGVVMCPTQRLLWVICGFSELYPVMLYVDTLLLPESQLPGSSC